MPFMGRAQQKLRFVDVAQDDHSSISGFSLGSQSDAERKKHARRRHPQVTFGKRVESGYDGRGLRACLVTRSDNRLDAGANNPAERSVGRVITSPSECKKPAPGLDYLLTPETEVTESEVKMSYTMPPRLINKCAYFPRAVDTRTVKTVATQTLYRESSAQTLPYLPEVVNLEHAETLELFSMTTILPGDKPPGLYEVEILERSRKRWAFTAALKTNFKRQFREAREKLFKSKYRNVLEAFEWEKWIEREEHIQECQMMRLDIVVRMFDRREKEMHVASKTRIELACEKIEERRRAALRKNEIKYQRAIRRLENKKGTLKSTNRKSSIAHKLSSPCSEFYAPLIRHGVDPARRHFTGGRKAFDMRIDDLEKRVNMSKLECPFSKLKKWAQPKTYVKEYEQNFTSDANLQKLYETLRSLRKDSVKQKATPKCLVVRQKPAVPETIEGTNVISMISVEPGNQDAETQKDESEPEYKESVYPEDLSQELLYERRKEELENMLVRYEGSTIGWIMQFLTEEMERLREQRKLHFFSILAQKERWRREAAEAGLRQKENDMRFIYDELFELTDVVNNEICNDYLGSILTTDIAHDAEWRAKHSVTELAKVIDADINRWLDSLKLIQTPLTYEPLRYVLRDYIFPDLKKILQENEKTLIAKYIIDDVLFPRIYRELEPWDITSSIIAEFLDRLLDDDLYYFSTESESEHISNKPAEYEVEAIIRKLIRYATPGRRWLTEDERNIEENIKDLLDDIFDAIIQRQYKESESSSIEPVVVHAASSKVRIDADSDPEGRRNRPSIPAGDSELMKIHTLSLFKKFKEDKISRPLTSDDVYMGDDGFVDTDPDKLLTKTVFVPKSETDPFNEDMVPLIYGIPSTLDIGEIDNYRKLIDIVQLQKVLELQERKSSSLSDIGIKFEPTVKKTAVETQTVTNDILTSLLRTILPSEDENVGGAESSHSLKQVYINDEVTRQSTVSRPSGLISEIMVEQTESGQQTPKPKDIGLSVSQVVVRSVIEIPIPPRSTTGEPPRLSGYVPSALLYEKGSSQPPSSTEEIEKTKLIQQLEEEEELAKEVIKIEQTEEPPENTDMPLEKVVSQEKLVKDDVQPEGEPMEAIETQAEAERVDFNIEPTEIQIEETDVSAQAEQKLPSVAAVEVEQKEAATEPQGEVVTATEQQGEVVAVIEEQGEVAAVTEEQGEVVTVTEQQVEDVTVTEQQVEDVTVTEEQGEKQDEIVTATEQQGEVVAVIEEQGEVVAVTEEQGEVVAATEQQVEIVAVTEEQGEVVAATKQQVEIVTVTEVQGEVVAATEQQVEIVTVTEEQGEVLAATEQQGEIVIVTEEQGEVVAATKQQGEIVTVTEEQGETATATGDQAETMNVTEQQDDNPIAVDEQLDGETQ